MERIVVAFSNEEAQRRILRLLESAGCSPAACCASGGEAIRTVRKLGGAVVVCGFKFRDMTASEVAASLRGTAVLLVLASAAHLDFCEGENLFKLPTPAARSEFSPRWICSAGGRPGAPAIPSPSGMRKSCG